jgi:hypothetical protein
VHRNTVPTVGVLTKGYLAKAGRLTWRLLRFCFVDLVQHIQAKTTPTRPFNTPGSSSRPLESRRNCEIRSGPSTRRFMQWSWRQHNGAADTAAFTLKRPLREWPSRPSPAVVPGPITGIDPRPSGDKQRVTVPIGA